jgi:hypothetical protein
MIASETLKHGAAMHCLLVAVRLIVASILSSVAAAAALAQEFELPTHAY